MGAPFKMKGNPMQRNFGIGSPLHDEKKKKTIVEKYNPINVAKALIAGTKKSLKTSARKGMLESHKKGVKEFRKTISE